MFGPFNDELWGSTEDLRIKDGAVRHCIETSSLKRPYIGDGTHRRKKKKHVFDQKYLIK